MKNLEPIRTLSNTDVTASDIALEDYDYQEKLTSKLASLGGDFTQETINEIVLWKVNRYFQLDERTTNLLNKINKEETRLQYDLTKEVLRDLLNVKGIRLPMASTILRFKNPHVYQIIDQRAYRFLMDENLKTYFSNIDQQIDYYLKYLEELRKQCNEKNIPFEKADQVLYQLDKKMNNKHRIKA